MSSNIMLNKNHIISSANNKLKYAFPNDVAFVKGDKIAVSSINMFFSWYNITAKYNNNFFQYKWWDMNGDLTVIVDVLIPDQYLTLNDLFEYLRIEMFKNGHYLKVLNPSPGHEYLYFIEILPNASFYAVELKLSSAAVEMDFGSGLTPVTNYCETPTTWKLPTQFETPQVIIPSNNSFGELLGFNPGIVTQNTLGDVTNKQYSFLNDYTPTLEPSSSFIMTCNLISNDLGVPNDIMYSFVVPNETKFGMLISPVRDVVYSKIKPGTYRDVIITVYDQNFIPLNILDNNMLITLSIVHDQN